MIITIGFACAAHIYGIKIIIIIESTIIWPSFVVITGFPEVNEEYRIKEIGNVENMSKGKKHAPSPLKLINR